MRKVVAALRTALAVPTFGVFTLLVSAVVFVLATVWPRTPWMEPIIRTWSRAFLSIAPLHLEVEGRERLDPARTYVVASNHLSNFDIPVLFLAIPVPIRYLAKKELFKVPILAQAMRRIGIVEIDREHARASHSKINEGVARAVARGHSIMVYPEAHRSEDGNLQPFKKGAFRIAIDHDLPVVPVTIAGTWDVWVPGAKVFYPGRARVVIHEPIETDGMTREDVPALLERTRTIIADHYETLRAAPDQS